MTFIDEESFREEKNFNDVPLFQETVTIDQYGFIYEKSEKKAGKLKLTESGFCLVNIAVPLYPALSAEFQYSS